VKPLAYYNEIDPNAAGWLRNLIDAGEISNGVVDERSISELAANDLVGRTRVHLFGGVGGWDVALRLAGWPEGREVWTGSCPCQPYSSAGKGKGNADERNLWPEMFRLIRECRPPVIFGEQVGSSLIVGPSGSIKDVQEVLDRKALFEVLQEFQGESAEPMHRMPERGRADEEAKKLCGSEGQPQAMAKGKSGICFSERRQASGKDARDSVQPDIAGHPESDQCRQVRANGHSVRFDPTPVVERSIAGQDRLDGRVHGGEHAGCSVFAECDGEHLGAEQDFGDCVGDFSEAKGSLERLVYEIGGAAEGTAEPVWFDGIRADLEAEGYTVRTSVLGAHSVGAPHIRQRLYWVAESKRAGVWGSRFGADGTPASGMQVADGERQRLRADAGPVRGNEPCRLPDAQHKRSPIEKSRSELGTQSTAMAVGLRNGILPRLEGHAGHGDNGNEPGRLATLPAGSTPAAGGYGGVALADGRESGDGNPQRRREQRQQSEDAGNNAWSDYAIILCADDRCRRVPAAQSEIQQLVDGLRAGLGRPCPDRFPLAEKTPGRVGRLKGYGNAIVPQVAAEFIRAYLDVAGMEAP
jgi:site-specific DNA-cytosine methylase